MISDKTVQYVCPLLEDNWCLTITDMQQEMAGCFSHKAGEATIIRALQQLEMQKVCTQLVSQKLMEERRKKLHGRCTQRASPLGLMRREPACQTSKPGSNPSWDAMVHPVCETFNEMLVV